VPCFSRPLAPESDAEDENDDPGVAPFAPPALAETAGPGHSPLRGVSSIPSHLREQLGVSRQDKSTPIKPLVTEKELLGADLVDRVVEALEPCLLNAAQKDVIVEVIKKMYAHKIFQPR
jgi:hypothetical protein